MGAFRKMLVGAQAITSSTATGVLVGFSVLATLVYGAILSCPRDVLGPPEEETMNDDNSQGNIADPPTTSKDTG